MEDAILGIPKEPPRQCRRDAVKGSIYCQAHGGTLDPNRVPAKPRKETGNTTQCTATANGSGQRCKRPAILGGTVCGKHGGKSPNVARKARQRMESMVGPAIQQLNEILTKPNTSDADRLRAIALLLDRCGFGPKNEVTLTVKPYENIVTTIFKELPDGEVIEGEVLDDPESIEDDEPEYNYEPEPERAQITFSQRPPGVPVPPPPAFRATGISNPPAYLR